MTQDKPQIVDPGWTPSEMGKKGRANLKARLGNDKEKISEYFRNIRAAGKLRPVKPKVAS